MEVGKRHKGGISGKVGPGTALRAPPPPTRLSRIPQLCRELLDHLVAHRWLQVSWWKGTLGCVWDPTSRGRRLRAMQVEGGDHGNRTYGLTLRTLAELDEFIGDGGVTGVGAGSGESGAAAGDEARGAAAATSSGATSATAAAAAEVDEEEYVE